MDKERMIAAWTLIGEMARRERAFVSTRHVCLACRDAVQVSGVGLTIADGERLWDPVLATDEKTAELEELQFTLGEGPTADAFESLRPVLAPDLAAVRSSRWPMFTAAAIECGINAVFSVPVQFAGAQAAVLNLYRDRPAPLSRGQLRDIRAHADAAFLLAMHDVQVPLDSSPEDAGPNFDAWRVEVHQAAGMVSVQMNVAVDEALAHLRARAYAEGRRLLHLAHDVLARRIRFSHREG